jgi:hypothetical protein
MVNKETIVINVDFDGTCVTHDYPEVGKDIGAVPVLKRLVAEGHQLILFTMRSDKEFVERDGSVTTSGLQDAIDWFVKNDIPLYGVQTNPTQHTWTNSPKSYAQLMIDDSALGCPLLQEFVWKPVAQGIQTTTYGQNSIQVPIGRPYVNWVEVEKILEVRGILTQKTK